MPPEINRTEALADLHARLHACRLCLDAGHDIFPRAIFSGGIGARIMLVGQAPGITEKEAGRPFNAGSGTRLFKWLTQAGIDEGWFRQSQYMEWMTQSVILRSRQELLPALCGHQSKLLPYQPRRV